MIDVSDDQHPDGQAIDWRLVREASIHVVAININSDYVREDAVGAHAAGLAVFFYWYLVATTSPGDAVAHIMSRIKGLPRDYGVAVDLEVPGGNAAELARDVLAKLPPEVVNRWLYVDLSMLQATSGAPWGHHLWLAEWDVSSPAVKCQAWQYTSAGTVPGVPAPVDRDVFYGAR